MRAFNHQVMGVKSAAELGHKQASSCISYEKIIFIINGIVDTGINLSAYFYPRNTEYLKYTKNISKLRLQTIKTDIEQAIVS